MQRDAKNLCRRVENVLGAVAVVVVDVDERDPGTGGQVRGGEGGVIEVAVAAEIIAPGVVARGTAQRVGGGRTSGQGPGAG